MASNFDNSNDNVISWNHAATNLYFSIFLNSSSNNVVIGNNASANQAAIYLLSSSYNNVSANTVLTYTHDGIVLDSSSYNTISSNNANGNGDGIVLGTSSNNNAISGNYAEGNGDGIYISSNNNVVSGNDVSASYTGIDLGPDTNNTIIGNNATGDFYGIELGRSSNDTISGNNIAENTYYGIYLSYSSNNTIYHNNFIGNAAQASVDDSTSVGNTWDNGYPSGGNYWSDYNGTDSFRGPSQNLTGSDGIGDTPYVIDANNTDYYPLMGVFSDFNVAQGVDVQAVSNSTVSDFQFNGTAVSFNVTGENGTEGFCRISFPTALINGNLTVFVNGTEVPYTLLPESNSTESYLYFTYNHSTEQVVVAPEFPTFILLSFFMIVTLIATVFYKKKAMPYKRL